MYEFPIKYFEENLIFNKQTKDCWAVFEIEGFSYDYLSADKKIGRLYALTRFISNIGAEAKILILPVAQNIRSHFDRIRSAIHKGDALANYAAAHATGTEGYLSERLRESGASNDYIGYAVVKLSMPKSLSSILDDLFKRPILTINELFEVEHKEILESELKSFLEASDAWFNEQSKRLRLKKTDAMTTQWLIRRMLHRGITAPLVLRKGKGEASWSPYYEECVKDGMKAIRPHEKDVLSLTEGLIEPGHRFIKITNTDGHISYQTFMTFAHIPDGLLFPGGEWLLMLQDFPIASEVCIHITTIEHRESVRKLAGKKREIKSQIEYVAENDSVPEELYEAQESADALEAELKRARDPLTEVSVSICVAAETEKEMEENARFIRERYEDVNFVIERPMADQFKLFYEFIPGSRRLMNDYVLSLPPRTLAGSMFPATRILGDNRGPYIGTTGILDKLVFLDMARACQLNRSASAAFLGTLGGGKSFNANLMLYLNILYGGRALIVDPKGERSGWLDALPELQDQIRITTLSAGNEDQGKLDPFSIYRDDMNDAGELALNILCEIFKINPKDDEYTAILEAIRLVKVDACPCMSRLAEILNSFDPSDELCQVAKRVGRRINLIREAGMAKLLFGTGKEAGLSFNQRVNILQIQNLQMPDPSTPKDDYTQEETISTVLMLPIASFAKKFAMANRSVFKLVLFDESWALNSTQMGVKLFNFLARMGRSLNAGSIFIGHSVNDLIGDGIKAAITYKFCFKATVLEEILRVLEFLDLEATDENIAAVSGLRNGECLFQDLDGHVGKLKFDAVYEHIIKAFDTTPDVSSQAQEKSIEV